jgi:hypothetical protein
MERFESLAHLYGEIEKLSEDNMDDFYSYQHFLFGCINWLRGFIEWPKIRESYEKAKLGLGVRSVFMKRPNWRDFSAFKGNERKSAQYTVYRLLQDLLEYQDLRMLRGGTQFEMTKLMKFVPKIQMYQIWKDTVVCRPKVKKKYPIELRRLAWEIRKQDKYSEIGVLGDMCEDMHGQFIPGFNKTADSLEEADHFHDTSCMHTYACRYLHNMCEGMDGR